RVALDVEEEVTRRRLGEKSEAPLVLQREKLVRVDAGNAVLELELGLAAELGEGRVGHARNCRFRRRRTELRERCDAHLRETPDRVAAHPRDADEVVALVEPRVALVEEVAAVAESAWIGLGFGPVADGGEETLAHAAVVGEEVADAIGLPLAGSEFDVEPL